ncbi:MAG TPA: hypothetical protein VLN49_08475, partial [Gemmatimonadaceae bacterium]|nr:hypothetical protein [Gemmatimonadaceae bacterium]
MFDRIRRDLSYTARSLRRTPAFSISVVLILGLAIALSSAMFTVFRSVLIERLPVEQQDRIVELAGIAGGAASEVPILPAQLRRLREQSHTLRAAAGLAHWRVLGEDLIDGDRRLSLPASVVTDDFNSRRHDSTRCCCRSCSRRSGCMGSWPRSSISSSAIWEFV